MSQQDQSEKSEGRSELPIERGFPIERVNEIAEKESRAKQYYRPIYTMHKWWARRPGCLFRAITMYSLLDRNTTPDDVEVYEPGGNEKLGNNGISKDGLIQAIENTSLDDPESLWKYYPKDVRIKNKKILDPFMGGGTSLVEASRFGVDTAGVDLNPVAWFVTKKELDAGETDIESLESAFDQVKENVAGKIKQYYKTACPNGNHEADVMYNFWIKELDCVSCEHTVPLFKDFRIAAGRYENDEKYNVLCPDCGEVTLVDEWKEESECGKCKHEFVPQEGSVSRGGYYNCPECGQKESITTAIADQGKPDMRLYAVEYYCGECDTKGYERSAYKGYKAANADDQQLFEKARQVWAARTDLHEYVPDEEVPDGATTIVTSEVNYDGHDLSQHGIEKWTDLFNERQLLSLSLLLESIENVSDENIREFLLLALSESLNYNSMMSVYKPAYNKNTNIFKSNSFDPPNEPMEGNVWGAEFGTGTFEGMWDMVVKGVKYANSPTDRHVTDGKTEETKGFSQSIGSNSEVYQDDMRNISEKNEYDAVITDPPYYDNIIYSELSDFFYVWQKSY